MALIAAGTAALATAAGFSLTRDNALWRPSGNTEIDKFRTRVNQKYGLALADYYDLHKWSVDEYSKFWEECFLQFGIKHSQKYTRVVDTSARMVDIPEWFEGARLNFAENLLSRKDDVPALIFNGELQEQRTMTYAQLRVEVARIAAALRKMGVKKGDRVVGYISNCIEAVAAMLATTSIGAIWSSTSPDFGENGVLDRFTQVEPRVIFSINAVNYNGKTHDHHGKLRGVCAGLKQLEKVVVVRFVKDAPVDLAGIPNAVLYDDFLEDAAPAAAPAPALEFEQLPFNHPVYILYSSGTTGKPKCIVHSAGGTLIQHKKELVLHGDLKAKEKLFYFTTTGWMMWNWLVSGLAVGATVCLYDGSPAKPHNAAMFDLIDSVGINVFGTSAKFLGACEAAGLKPRDTHSLRSLRCILSTGSPLHPPQYDWVYSAVKAVLLGSITGGTDIISCFAGSNPAIPVYRGEIQMANLGMNVASFDAKGKSVVDRDGDLVCLTPFPSMPVYFWKDEGNAKYKAAYFEKHTHNGQPIWCHGDFVNISKRTGGLHMLGRSDGVLNPSGVRFGSAELYNVLLEVPEVADCVAVGQMFKGDERVVLFVQAAPPATLNADLVAKIKTLIRSKLSARHVPAKILPIADVPYTISGKKVEIAVKRIIHGAKITERGALRNPDSLDLFAAKEVQEALSS